MANVLWIFYSVSSYHDRKISIPILCIQAICSQSRSHGLYGSTLIAPEISFQLLIMFSPFRWWTNCKQYTSTWTNTWIVFDSILLDCCLIRKFETFVIYCNCNKRELWMCWLITNEQLLIWLVNQSTFIQKSIAILVLRTLHYGTHRRFAQIAFPFLGQLAQRQPLTR